MTTEKTKSNKTKTNKTKNIKEGSIKEEPIKEEESNKELTISSLINGKTRQLTYIIYNKKPYGYFYLGEKMLEYYGERKIKIDFDKVPKNDNFWEKLYKKRCIGIFFHKEETKNLSAYLNNFFYEKKNELCLSKKNIKPQDMFPLFDIFIQELKLHKLGLYDASRLHLKYCDYSLELLGLIEKEYTYYNKFGFIPILPERIKKTTPKTITAKTTPTLQTKKTKKIKKVSKKVVKEDFNIPLKLTPIRKTTTKISKSVKDIQNIKMNYLLHILEHYRRNLSDYSSIEKTKDILFDNLSENVKYRIKEIINIYNKENLNNHYKYSYNQILNLNIKEFILEFILFFCNYKKDNIQYLEKVNYITNIIKSSLIKIFNRK